MMSYYSLLVLACLLFLECKCNNEHTSWTAPTGQTAVSWFIDHTQTPGTWYTYMSDYVCHPNASFIHISAVFNGSFDSMNGNGWDILFGAVQAACDPIIGSNINLMNGVGCPNEGDPLNGFGWGMFLLLVA